MRLIISQSNLYYHKPTENCALLPLAYTKSVLKYATLSFENIVLIA